MAEKKAVTAKVEREFSKDCEGFFRVPKEILAKKDPQGQLVTLYQQDGSP